MTKRTTSNPMAGAVPIKPPIDRENAQDIEPDAPMPTIENAPGSYFKPGGAISTMDVVEITLMYLLQISGSPAVVQKGALRTQMMSADRVDQLSDSAQRWMQAIQPSQDQSGA